MGNIKSKISIIMPVFNASKYLEFAIESVINQSFTDFELICIDDGSNDVSFEILKKYASIDKRIHVFQNEYRMGAAQTRNKGIELSSSDYLIFLDADDIFDDELLALSYEKMKYFDLDLVYFDCIHLDSEEINKPMEIYHSSSYVKSFCTEPFDLKKRNCYECAIFSLTTWCRMYNRRLIEKYELRFQNLESSNDVAFSFLSILFADRIMALDAGRPLVRARDHFEQSRISYHRNQLCAYDALVYVKKKLIEMGTWESTKNMYVFKTLSNCLTTLRRIKDEKEFESFLVYMLNNWKKDIINDVELDMCLKNFVEKMQYEKFCIKDVHDEGILKWSLYIYPSILIDKLKEYSQKYNSLVVWGAGYNGTILLGFVKKFKIPIYKVVDGNADNIGKEILGYKIERLNKDDLLKRLLIIATPDNAYNDICETVSKMGFKNAYVIDLKGTYSMI